MKISISDQYPQEQRENRIMWRQDRATKKLVAHLEDQGNLIERVELFKGAEPRDNSLVITLATPPTSTRILLFWSNRFGLWTHRGTSTGEGSVVFAAKLP